jgi:hypothetical protein
MRRRVTQLAVLSLVALLHGCASRHEMPFDQKLFS